MKKFLLVLLIIGGGLFLLERVLGQHADRRSYVYFDDMYQSVAYNTESPNPHLPGGATQMPPVAGTIPRGYAPLHYGGSEEESIRAGEELVNPFAADSTVHLARGQAVYQTYCQPCHGPGGEGDGPVARRGYPPPPSLLADQTRNRADGQMFHMITYGYKNMPAYASQIERDDRWHVIAYVRQLQTQAAQMAQEAQNDTLRTAP